MSGRCQGASRMCGRPYRLFGNGREILPDVQECWESLPDVREAAQKPGSIREALTDVWKWSGGLPRYSGGLADVLEWWEALPDVGEW